MSTENVGLFVTALTKGGDLTDRVASSEHTPSAWIALAREAGYEFSAQELQAFMKELLELDELEAEGAVEAFLSATKPGPGELSHEQLDALAGGGGGGGTNLAFSGGLMRRLTSLGFGGGPGNVAAYEEFPPMHILSPNKMDQFTRK